MKLLPLLPLALVFAVGNLHANGGGYSTGLMSTSDFQPIGVDQVQMLSEHLEIDLHLEYAEVRVEYVLHNPGKKLTVECGFPAVFDNEQNMFAPQPAMSAEARMLEGFKFEADERPIKAALRKDEAAANSGSMRLESWHVVKIPFGAGQTRHVKASYRNPYHRSVHGVSDDWYTGSPSLTYAFSAAALWAGSIKQGTVIINPISVDPAKVKLSHPKRYVLEKGRWTWSFTDFEPTLEDDLVIKTRPSLNGYHGGYVAEGGDRENKGAKWGAYQDFTATASSTLKEPDGSEHPAENVTDWSRESAWVEGVEGNGLGESLTLTLAKPAKVNRVGIRNGYTKSPKLYLANSRVMQLRVSVNGGKAFTVELPDEYLEHEHFWFDLPKTEGLVKTVRLEIGAIYPGTAYTDTAIADIKLYQFLDKKPKIQQSR